MRWLKEGEKESGAVAVMFALSLVVLMGFVGAGVDVASAYAKSQEVQNGADAAALAVAQQCATSSTGCTGDTLIAQELAESNIRLEKGSVTTVVTYPAANQVTVVAEGDNQNYLLGLFGHPSFRVQEEATATWGSPDAGPAMLPLAISVCSFEESLGDAALDVPVEIYIPKNNDGVNSVTECDWHADYPAGGFGWLSTAGGSCETEVAVDDWVASSPGMAQPSNCDFSQFIGKTALIPIFDDDAGSGSWSSLHIARFAAFEVLGITLQTGSDYWGVKCAPSGGPDYMKTCIRGKFVEYVSVDDGYESSDPDTEVAVVTLID